MNVLLVSNVKEKDESFNDPLREGLSKFAHVETVNYRNVPPVDKLEAAYQGIVTSGTPLSYPLGDIDTRVAYIQWIKTVNLPILGICLGHQNIGRLFHSQLILDREAEEGKHPLQIARDDPLFVGIDSGEEIVEHHRASVSLPEDFVLLASTSTCVNQAMRHATRPIYSVQFHPELSGKTGLKIFDNFVKLLERKLSR